MQGHLAHREAGYHYYEIQLSGLLYDRVAILLLFLPAIYIHEIFSHQYQPKKNSDDPNASMDLQQVCFVTGIIMKLAINSFYNEEILQKLNYFIIALCN